MTHAPFSSADPRKQNSFQKHLTQFSAAAN